MRALLACLILMLSTAHAEMDSDSQKGLSDTRAMLTNPTARQGVVNQDPKAKDVDNKVNALTGGGAGKEQIYDLASQIMEKIAAEAGGDPKKMQELLADAHRNPQAFYQKYFSEDQKRAVSNVSEKIEKNHPSSSPKN